MSNVFVKFNGVQINAYFGHVFSKNIEIRSITVRLCVWLMFPNRKPRSCTEKRGFLQVVKRGIPKWTLSGEFFKKHGSFEKIRNFLKTRDF